MDEILRVENLCKYFPVKTRGRKSSSFKAVDGVSFSVEKGSCFGLVGESGSGKTTTGRSVLRLIEPTSGRIIYSGEDITKANMAPYRRKMQIIFQNPSGSLDSKYQVGDIIAEGMRANSMSSSKKEETERVEELLKLVGLFPEDAQRYPGEFSGGQQQRIGIARALAVEPEFMVCDEPVSALDVSYQAQIINLLKRLQREKGLSYLFISHDMSVVRHMSDRLGVMYKGHLVESGDAEEIITHPAHPYTKALLSAIPVADPDAARNKVHQPEVPEVDAAEGGCGFAFRCPYAKPECRKAQPEYREIASGHFCSCHLY
ncbi:MAG: ABC transporter ATP-binding protein [Firmicutes bacterium]|nr:ABC transporter ATP-binding protein [Bacillota bacterium]